MRGRSSKHRKEAEKARPREEPHISGAYIRSLVKQLTSSKSKDPMNLKAAPETAGAHGEAAPNLSTARSNTEGSGQNKTQQSQPPQPKKQVRRRLHTSRPYQERLLNMAEARREIVTALKFHRAAMKQASEQQQQQQSSLQQQPQAPPCLEPVLEKMKTRKAPRIYPSSDTASTFSNYLNNYSYPAFSSTTPPFSWASPPIIPPLPVSESFNINLPLPNQPLGLNLNLHDFNNVMDASLYNSNNNPSIFLQSSSTPSSSSSLQSSSPSSSSLSPPMCVDAPSVPNVFSPPSGTHLHHAMDDEEMAEIRLIGEQHEMEWNDRVNLVTSAWWFKFLKTMEMSPAGQDENIRGGEDGFHFLDEMMDIPAWLNDGCSVVGNAPESCSFLQHRWDDLPCLDIGEIEAMDGDWLA